MRVKDTSLDARKVPRVLENREGSTGPGWVRLVGNLVLMGAVALIAGESQVPQYSATLPGLSSGANPHDERDQSLRNWARHEDNVKRLKALSIARYKEMNADAGKLITLANEVKAETDRQVSEKSRSSSKDGIKDGSKDALTIADLRKVELIEKLAKSVREKMTATITVE